MPICDGAPLGAPCWIDLTSSDLERAQDFYGTVFGWTFESQGPGDRPVRCRIPLMAAPGSCWF